MQWLASISVRRPVFASVLILFVCVLGVAGYIGLSIDRFPKVDIPTAIILTTLPGAAPEEVESEVTDRIEEAINTVSGIDDLSSISSEGVSQVMVQFVLEKNIDVAVQEIRDKIALAMVDLPNNVDQPIVSKFDPDASPVLLLSLNAKDGLREITEVADRKVRRAIESVSGVGQVTILGGHKRQIHVWLDPVRLHAAGLTPVQVQQAIVSQNLMMPGGSLETGPERLSLRILGRVNSPEELNDVVLARRADHLIRLGDVATVQDGEEEPDTAATINGVPTVILSVRKQSGANTVAIVDTVRERLTEISKVLPPGYQLEVVRDNSETTRTSVHAVIEHLVLGSLFAALVVLFFLGNWQGTVIAALAIPTSIIGTFGMMKALDFSLNTITLLALALAVGIVIDDAIVVLENIFKFVHEKNIKPFPAAILATREIGLAVLATTLSLIAVFLPVVFMGGVPGRFLASFGWTMAFSIAISLLVSFTLTPMLAARWLHTPAEEQSKRGGVKSAIERFADRIYQPIEHRYERALRWVMAHRWVAVVMALVTLGSCVPLGAMVPKGFLPKSDEAQFEITVRAPEGTSVDSTQLMADRVARDVRELSQVRFTLLTIGDSNTRASNIARIFVRLVDPGERKENQDELMDVVRRTIASKQPPELKVTVSNAAFFSGAPTEAAVQFVVSGPDLQRLSEYSDALVNKLRAIPGAVDADSSLVLGKPEISVIINRLRAADLGVSVSDIATTLQLFVGGLRVSTYAESGNQYEVRVRADKQFRASQEALGLLTVPSQKLGTVPLLDVVRLERRDGPAQINRLNRQRQVMITANTAPGVGAGEIVTALGKAASELGMPSGYYAGPIGQSREIGRTARNFVMAFGLAFIFMYLVLAAQFESWIHPFTILLSLPLTVPFALLSLLIFGQALDIYSMLGILVLFGVVKKNSILQVDRMNQLRHQGMSRLEAIIRGNRDRLRPILMTTMSFVAGMVPLVTSTGIGSGFNRATAGVVVGGQTLSLFLTLLVTPVAYSLIDDAIAWFNQRVWRSTRSKDVTGEANLKELLESGE